MKLEIKHIIKTTPGISLLYNKVVSKLRGEKFSIESLPKINPKFIDAKGQRITLVVPSFNSVDVYGGLSTALSIFNDVLKKNNAKGRILVLTGKFNEKTTYKAKNIFYGGTKGNLLYCSENDSIEVGENDIFITTFWTTTFCIMPVLQQQMQHFHLKNRKLVYLIQDYEPGFYPWSTEYVLADSTYKNNSKDILAFFNTKLLSTYFTTNNYDFGEKIVFDPQLNAKLKKLLPVKSEKREKVILIYGRPNVPRNCFDLIKSGLELWSKEYDLASQWKVISLGSQFDNIRLSSNVIVSKGKVSLTEYADYMKHAFVGISLMESPHPSYPPLEMSTFGVKTITNSYECKDLSGFNENIFSLNFCTPQEICNKLIQICNYYYNDPLGRISLNNDYVGGENFNSSVKLLSGKISEMLN